MLAKDIPRALLERVIEPVNIAIKEGNMEADKVETAMEPSQRGELAAQETKVFAAFIRHHQESEAQQLKVATF
eukprot:1150104-Pelagomonas_calceolata.AAC.4